MTPQCKQFWRDSELRVSIRGLDRLVSRLKAMGLEHVAAEAAPLRAALQTALDQPLPQESKGKERKSTPFGKAKRPVSA